MEEYKTRKQEGTALSFFYHFQQAMRDWRKIMFVRFLPWYLRTLIFLAEFYSAV